MVYYNILFDNTIGWDDKKKKPELLERSWSS